MIREKINILREKMKERKIDLYVIPTDDYHLSEYVGDYFKEREFMSGFTGSAGTLVVTKEEAGLFTDGRYFIQAEKELEGSGIILFRSGVAGVPSVEEYCGVYMQSHQTMGFDGKTVTGQFVESVEKHANGKKICCRYEEDLVDELWLQRPELSHEPVYILPDKYAGEDACHKLERLRKVMLEKHAESHILTSLDDIAWLFNLRGSDVENNPVALAYAVITLEQAYLYIQEQALNAETKEYFEKNGIIVKEYDTIYRGFAEIIANKHTLLLDKNKVNYFLQKQIPETVTCIDEENPTLHMKAVKNITEIKNTKRIHLKDGAAVAKFMYWLKNTIGKEPLTEYQAGKKMDSFRAEIPEYKDLSFETICAYGENAAMMHYSAKKDSCAELKEENFLLVDCGGQYYEGTTDITRTFVLGKLTKEQKKHFTAVVCGMLRLQNAKFLYGCNGYNLDILSRGAVWDLGIDYRCGTGHGVGSFLNVHEGPNAFRWKRYPFIKNNWVFEEGMVTTDEPGIYIEGSHGIRIENELLCVKDEKNEWGQFMRFEPLTYAPIDLDGIDVQYMQEKDIQLLNTYHQTVYEKISPYLDDKEREWLKHATRQI